MKALKKLILKGSKIGPRGGALVLSRIVNMSKSDTADNNASAIGTYMPEPYPNSIATPTLILPYPNSIITLPLTLP